VWIAVHCRWVPVLVASHNQWRRLEEALTYPPAKLYAAERHYLGPPLRDDRVPAMRLRVRAADAEHHAVDRLRQRRVPSVRRGGVVYQRASEGGLSKAETWRRNGTEFLMAEVWLRFWNAARDAAGLSEGFTPYNARHTGISWAIDKGVDLQKVRQRAGHGSLEVTSRYAAILDERDTSLADALEEIFDDSRPAVGGHKGTTELTAVPRAV
jgi:hypothetical protein